MIATPAPPTQINGKPVLAWAADIGAMFSPATGWSGHVLCRLDDDEFVTWQVALVDTQPFPDEIELLRWNASSGHYFKRGINSRSEREALEQAHDDFVQRIARPLPPCPGCGGDPLTAPPCVTHDTDLGKGMVTGPGTAAPLAEFLGPLLDGGA